MASRGQTLTITYVAWDTANNVGKTGDNGNHTLRWVKDGSSSPPDNSPAEVDATNAPGAAERLARMLRHARESGQVYSGAPGPVPPPRIRR